MASAESRDLAGSAFPFASRNVSRVVAAGARLAIIDGSVEMLVARGGSPCSRRRRYCRRGDRSPPRQSRSRPPRPRRCRPAQGHRARRGRRALPAPPPCRGAQAPPARCSMPPAPRRGARAAAPAPPARQRAAASSVGHEARRGSAMAALIADRTPCLDRDCVSAPAAAASTTSPPIRKRPRRMVAGAQPVPAPRRSYSQSGRDREGLRRAGAPGAGGGTNARARATQVQVQSPPTSSPIPTRSSGFRRPRPSSPGRWAACSQSPSAIPISSPTRTSWRCNRNSRARRTALPWRGATTSRRCGRNNTELRNRPARPFPARSATSTTPWRPLAGGGDARLFPAVVRPCARLSLRSFALGRGSARSSRWIFRRSADGSSMTPGFVDPRDPPALAESSPISRPRPADAGGYVVGRHALRSSAGIRNGQPARRLHRRHRGMRRSPEPAFSARRAPARRAAEPAGGDLEQFWLTHAAEKSATFRTYASAPARGTGCSGAYRLPKPADWSCCRKRRPPRCPRCRDCQSRRGADARGPPPRLPRAAW